MEPIRSIQVVNVRWFNATAWYALFLTRLLREAGHPTIVLGLPGTDSFKKAEAWGLAPRALDLNAKNPLALAGCLKRMGELVDGFKPQVVNCHRGEGFFLWSLLRGLKSGAGGEKSGGGFAIVRTRGDQRPARGNFANRLLYGPLADALIASNSRIKRNLVEDLRVPSAKISLIPGGVDDALFFPDPVGRARVRAEFGFAERDFVVGLVGRYDPVKGHATLFEALRLLRLKDSALPLKVLLIGREAGFKASELDSMAKGAGLAGLVTHSGERPDVNACINAMDLGVLASNGSEAVARAAFEIMAAGVPLLSTNIGVMPDLLPQALLLAPEDPSGMAAAIGKVAFDPAFRNALLQGAVQTMNHSRRADFLEQTLAAYRGAVLRRG